MGFNGAARDKKGGMAAPDFREGATRSKEGRKRWDRRHSRKIFDRFFVQGALNVDSEIQHLPIFSGLLLIKSYRSLNLQFLS